MPWSHRRIGQRFFARCALGLVLLGCASTPVRAEGPKLKLLKNFVIRQSLRQSESAKIFTVNDRLNYDRGAFRPLSPSRGENSWRVRDLVCADSGGLENPGYAAYALAIQGEVPKPYDLGSFSFSGPAEALISIVGVGWGSSDNNGDFIPLLLSESYEDKTVPHYSVIWEWERRTGFPGLGGRVYLDYLIKIPKRSQVKGETKLSFKRGNFAGSFSLDAPIVAAGKIYRWRNFRFQRFKDNLQSPPEPLPWKLPRDLKPNGFAVSAAADRLFMAAADGKISAWSIDGKKRWEVAGQAPVLSCQGRVLAPDLKYRALNVFKADSGEKIASVELPAHLPKEGNCLCSFTCGGLRYLLLIIPEQSNALLFSMEG